MASNSIIVQCLKCNKVLSDSTALVLSDKERKILGVKGVPPITPPWSIELATPNEHHFSLDERVMTVMVAMFLRTNARARDRVGLAPRR